MDDLELIRAWTALRMDIAGRMPLFKTGGATRKKVRGYLTQVVGKGRLDGRLATRLVDGRLTAAIALEHQPAPWLGPSTDQVTLDADPDDPDAPQWIVDTLRRWCPVPELYIPLLGGNRPVLEALLAADLGIGIDSIVLVGEVNAGREALIDRYDPPPTMPAGLELGPVDDVATVDAVIAIQREVFGAEPEYCWFGAHPRFLAGERASLLAHVLEPDPLALQRVIRVDGVVRGHFAAVGERDNPFWGSVGGLGLNLGRELRGRGLGKRIYRIALDHLAAHSIELFKGGTAQPPVLGLAKVMGRQLDHYELRCGVPFDRAHFQGWV